MGRLFSMEHSDEKGINTTGTLQNNSATISFVE